MVGPGPPVTPANITTYKVDLSSFIFQFCSRISGIFWKFSGRIKITKDLTTPWKKRIIWSTEIQNSQEDEMNEEKKRRGRPPGSLLRFLTIRITPETLAGLDRLAAADGRSTGGFVRRTLEQFVAAEIPNSPAPADIYARKSEAPATGGRPDDLSDPRD